MKKIRRIIAAIVVTAFFGLPLLMMSQKQAQAAIYQYDMEQILAEDSLLWTLLADFQRPDDADCLTKTNTFANANIDYLRTVFPWVWEPGSDVAEGSAIFCNIMENIPDQIQSIMTNAGAFGKGLETTNIFDPEAFPNWHNIENFVVDTAWGKIEFNGTIDLLDHDFVFFALSFVDVTSIEQGFVSINSDLAKGFRNISATITMKNVPDFENLEILVNGKKDTEGIVSNIVYDRENKTITFDVNHFSSFQAAEYVEQDDDDEDEEDPKIHTAKIQRIAYKAGGEQYFKVVIKGKDFDKDSNAYLGGRKAWKVNKVSDRKIVAYFKTFKFKNAPQNLYKLKVTNDGEKDTYKKQLPIKNLPLVIIE